MGLLQQIQSGRQANPPRLLVYGVEGIGKSTLASQAPGTIFIQTENGLGEIDCEKFPLSRSFDDVMAAITELYEGEHRFQTVAIDSLDWLERLIHDLVCKKECVTSIEKAGGGYGKGYHFAIDYWRQLLDGLAALHVHRRMAVILLAHAKVERFEDPEASAYDRYSPRLHKSASAILTEWCDAVLFATRRFRTQTEDLGFNRTRTIAAPLGKDGGDRILRTVGSPACVAKNRYGFDAELPLSWDAVAAGISASQAIALAA